MSNKKKILKNMGKSGAPKLEASESMAGSYGGEDKKEIKVNVGKKPKSKTDYSEATKADLRMQNDYMKSKDNQKKIEKKSIDLIDEKIEDSDSHKGFRTAKKMSDEAMGFRVKVKGAKK